MKPARNLWQESRMVGEMDRDRDADRRSRFWLEGWGEVECWRISQEKRKWPHAGWSFWGHTVCPCLPCPQRGPRRTFLKCLTTPQAASKSCCRWTFMPLAESYSIFICLLMCIFEGETPRNIFMPHTAPEGKDHKQSPLCQIAFYCDVLIWECRRVSCLYRK